MRFLSLLLSVLLAVSSAQATIARVQAVAATTLTGAGTTLTFSPSALTTGNYIIIAICSSGGQDMRMSTSEANLIGGRVAYSYSSGSTIFVTIYFYKVISGGQTSITAITAAANTTQMAGILVEYSGRNITPDTWAISNTGTSTSPATGTTGTTAVANELVFAALGMKGTMATEQTNWVNTPTNSFSIISPQTSSSTNTSNDKALAVLERIVTSTGTFSTGATATLSSAVWTAGIVTFREIPQVTTATESQ